MRTRASELAHRARVFWHLSAASSLFVLCSLPRAPFVVAHRGTSRVAPAAMPSLRRSLLHSPRMPCVCCKGGLKGGLVGDKRSWKRGSVRPMRRDGRRGAGGIQGVGVSCWGCNASCIVPVARVCVFPSRYAPFAPFPGALPLPFLSSGHTAVRCPCGARACCGMPSHCCDRWCCTTGLSVKHSGVGGGRVIVFSRSLAAESALTGPCPPLAVYRLCSRSTESREDMSKTLLL